jgi:hypothetical protein
LSLKDRIRPALLNSCPVSVDMEQLSPTDVLELAELALARKVEAVLRKRGVSIAYRPGVSPSADTHTAAPYAGAPSTVAAAIEALRFSEIVSTVNCSSGVRSASRWP